MHRIQLKLSVGAILSVAGKLTHRNMSTRVGDRWALYIISMVFMQRYCTFLGIPGIPFCLSSKIHHSWSSYIRESRQQVSILHMHSSNLYASWCYMYGDKSVTEFQPVNISHISPREIRRDSNCALSMTILLPVQRRVIFPRMCRKKSHLLDCSLAP